MVRLIHPHATRPIVLHRAVAATAALGPDGRWTGHITDDQWVSLARTSTTFADRVDAICAAALCWQEEARK